jgi:DNA-binding response OmpR family regulator
MWQFIQSILATLSGRVRKNNQDPRYQTPNDEGSPEGAPCIRIVSVLEGAEDRCLLDDVSARNQWDIFFANACDEACRLSDRLKPAVILFDRDVAGADWRQAVSSLASVSGSACILLISRVADNYLWNEVVSNGGYDVLPKPLREDEVLRAVRLAWSYWKGVRRAGAIARK